MTSTHTDARDARVQRLRATRARDSEDKRTRALEACARLFAAGTEVTHARVAREAQVSSWLTYNARAVREAIEGARTAQLQTGITPARSLQDGNRISYDSLRTDLALSREDNQKLRAEVSRLKVRLQQRLGAEIEETSATELLERLRELQTQSTILNRKVATRDSRIATLEARVAELEVELEAKTEVLRAMMFAANATPQSGS